MSSIEENKEVIRQYIKALGTGDLQNAVKYFHKDFVFYPQYDHPYYGAEGFLAAEQKAFAACTDGYVRLEYMVAEGDKVAALVVMEGLHTNGLYYGLRPQGKRFRYSVGMFFEFKDGLICVKRGHYDRADGWIQLGATDLEKYIQSL